MDFDDHTTFQVFFRTEELAGAANDLYHVLNTLFLYGILEFLAQAFNNRSCEMMKLKLTFLHIIQNVFLFR